MALRSEPLKATFAASSRVCIVCVKIIEHNILDK